MSLFEHDPVTEVVKDEGTKKLTFLSHVFCTTEKGKAEMFNTIQYASMGLIPVILLNKLIQRLIPEADAGKSSLELLVEIFLQIIIIFGGIVLIHRTITFLPTFSEIPYEPFAVNNAILTFLVILLSIQSKMGLKSNILYDRSLDMWNGTSGDEKPHKRPRTQESMVSQHNSSQADNFDEGPAGVFPPLPMSTNRGNSSLPMQQQQTQQQQQQYASRGGGGENMIEDHGPQPANGFLGGSFGTSF